MPLKPRARRDDGMTLIELLIVIALIAVIVAPLTAIVIVSVRTTDQAADTLSESFDAQLTTAYFSQDVQSAGVRDWSAAGFPVTASIWSNLSPDPCGSATALLHIAWDDPAIGAPSVRRVSYVVVGGSGGPRELRRITCGAGGTTERVLAHNIDSTVDPEVRCLDSAGATMGSCAVTPLPASVELTLHLRALSSTDAYTVTLVGHRRQT